jgi:AcrR family transcriptional regulator
MATRTDVRQRILQTAFGLLADHGVSWLTQPRVSRAAGVRQSHLTYYFPTRGDLLVGLARYSLEVLAGPLQAQAEMGALDPAQLPEILFHALSDRRRIRAILGLVHAADEDEKVRDALRELIPLVRSRLGGLFGALGLPNDAHSMAVLHSFVVGAAVLYHARADKAASTEARAVVRSVAALMPQLGKASKGRREK